MSSFPEIAYIMEKLEELSQEVADLKAHQREVASINISVAEKESAILGLAEQTKRAVEQFNVQGKKAYITHTVLKAEQLITGQLMWLEELLTEDPISTARFCLALSHEHRINLLKTLTEGEKTTSQLSDAVGLEGGPLYHHLKELINAKFVVLKERSVYKITPQGFDAMMTITALNRRNRYQQESKWEEGSSDES